MIIGACLPIADLTTRVRVSLIPMHNFDDQEEVTIHTHMLSVSAIGPRRFYRHLKTYDRPLNLNEEADQALVADIRTRGLQQPIVVFNAREENELWLISGDRRLRALWLIGTDPIPAIVCQDFDSLFEVLMKELADSESKWVKPFTWTDRMDYGMILRGVQLFLRAYRRPKNQPVSGCTISIDEIAPLLDCNRSQWRDLRMISAGRVKYEKQDRTKHDPDLANKLLAKIDKGLMTTVQARVTYLNRGDKIGPGHHPASVTSTRWRTTTASLVNSLSINSVPLEELLQSVNDDITSEELTELLNQITTIRRTIGRAERHAQRAIDHRNEVTE